jgi:hypothetical protein
VKLLRKARRQLDRLEAKLTGGKLASRVSEPCRDELRGLIGEARTVVDEVISRVAA